MSRDITERIESAGRVYKERPCLRESIRCKKKVLGYEGDRICGPCRNAPPEEETRYAGFKREWKKAGRKPNVPVFGD